MIQAMSEDAAIQDQTSRRTALPSIAVDLRALVGVPSGIGVYTDSLLRELAARGRARYTGMSHRPIHEPQRLARLGVALQTHGGPLGVYWQQLTLPSRLSRGNFDLLWSPINTLPLRCPVPSVVTIHDLTTLLYPRAHRLKVRLSVRPFIGSTVRQARRIAVDSRATADDLRRRFPRCAGRVEVVYPGIDPEFQPAGRDEIAAFRERLGCPDGYFLFAGTLEPRKNLAALLGAWEALRASRPGAPPLLLAGPYGWRSRSVLQRIEALRGAGLRHLGRVPRDELVRLMQSATAFVYPSRYEGFGLPPAEAMACGVPVVTSDRSSLPEVVGDAGVMVDPDRPAAITAALGGLLDDPGWAAELGDRGRRRSRQFSWRGCADLMQSLFDAALA